MMTTDAPAWGQWTTFYDSAGQVPSMSRTDSGDGRVVEFTMDDHMLLNVGGDQDAPFARAVGLSGSLSVSIPDTYPLVGFLLIVRGTVMKSFRSEAAVSCSIGHSTKSIEWPVGDSGPKDFLDFEVRCLLTDGPPQGVIPQLPPVPITISTQIRRRFVDDVAVVQIGAFEVLIVR
jgi:hypothetical protein